MHVEMQSDGNPGDASVYSIAQANMQFVSTID